MKIFNPLVVSAFAGMLMLGSASAGPISGSMEIGTLGTTLNDGNSVGITTKLTTSIVQSGSTFGDYNAVPVPLGTLFTTFTLDLTDFTTFTFTNGTYGKFIGTSGEIVSQTDNGQCPSLICGGFLDVYILGTYSDLPGFDPTSSSFRISFTQTGESISASGTLASPAAPPPETGAPEPATLGLFGSALIGLGLIGRKHLFR
jgi:hypothetical protein